MNLPRAEIHCQDNALSSFYTKLLCTYCYCPRVIQLLEFCCQTKDLTISLTTPFWMGETGNKMEWLCIFLRMKYRPAWQGQSEDSSNHCTTKSLPRSQRQTQAQLWGGSADPNAVCMPAPWHSPPDESLHHSKLTPTHLHSFKPQLKSYLLKEPFPDPSSKLLSPLYILSFPSMDLMQFVHRHYSCVYLMSICFRPSTTNSMTAGNGLTKAHCHKHHAQQSTWHITGTWIFGLNWVNKWLSIRHP